GEPFLSRIIERYDGPRYTFEQVCAALRKCEGTGSDEPVNPQSCGMAANSNGNGHHLQSRYSQGALRKAVKLLGDAPDGGKWAALRREAYALGGLPGLNREDVVRALVEPIRARCRSVSHAERTARAAFDAGAAKPRQVPERNGKTPSGEGVNNN